MIRHSLPLALAALAAPGAAASEDGRVVALAQLTIHERIVIRVPRVAPARLQPGRTPIATPVTWKEGKGPKCVGIATLGGAAINGPNVVDLVLTGGARVRARLDGDCAPLDFYSGFYIRPPADGKVCAGRDAIRVRTGASCMIRQFRALTPAR